MYGLTTVMHHVSFVECLNKILTQPQPVAHLGLNQIQTLENAKSATDFMQFACDFKPNEQPL